MEPSNLNRILIVEDERDIQAVARLALEAVGKFTVEICSSGQEAVERGPEFNPDLILLDAMMPGMDGPTTFQALRRLPRLADVPIIFMTARVQPQERAEYAALGAIGLVAKPFDPMSLSSTIREVWQQHYG